jgi:large conductance mechanosensitive channel
MRYFRPMAKILEEFREFALKGNAVDLAVGIVVGAAFNKIVSSLVDDVFMPPLGWAIGGVDFKNLQWVLAESVKLADGTVKPEVAVRYGAFLNTLIQFVIIAWSAFIVVKVMNRLIGFRGRKEDAPKN